MDAAAPNTVHISLGATVSTHDVAYLTRLRMEFEEVEKKFNLKPGTFKLEIKGDMIEVTSTDPDKTAREYFAELFPEPVPRTRAELNKLGRAPRNRAERRAMKKR